MQYQYCRETAIFSPYRAKMIETCRRVQATVIFFQQVNYLHGIGLHSFDILLESKMLHLTLIVTPCKQVVGLLNSFQPLNSVSVFQQYDGLQRRERKDRMDQYQVQKILYPRQHVLCLKKMPYQTVELLSAYGPTQPVDQEQGYTCFNNQQNHYQPEDSLLELG